MSEIQPIISPILTYEHPEHANRIDLVGTVHIAEPPYYQAIQEFVDARVNEGATVHYEMSKRPTPAELAAAPRAVRRKVERLQPLLGELYGMMGEIDGLVPQKKGLAYREEWKNHDSTILEQTAGMSRLTIDGLWAGVQITKIARRLIGKEAMQTLILEQLSEATNEEEYNPGLVERGVSIGHQKYVVNARNDIAMAAVDAELQTDPSKDIVLLWGSGHLKGMDLAVRNRGFVQTGERVLTAIHPR